jgi:hypothetical protein
LPNSTSDKPRVYTAAPKRLHTEDTSDRPAVLPLRPEPIPVTMFARLHSARAEGDYDLARRCLRELRGYGYSVVVMGSAPKPKKGARA